MEQYIPKSALVAEIEKLIDEIYAGRPFDALSSGQQTALWYIKSIMSSINILKVQEVDLEKEIANLYESNYEDYLTYEEFADIAKHFFELGLKTQKGE